MAINVSQPFHRTSAGPIDDSLNLSKAQMLTVNDNLMPSKWFTVCADDGQFYLYDKSNEPDEETGKFRLYQSGKTYSSGDGIDVDNENDEISVDEMPAEDMSEIVTPLPSIKRPYDVYSTKEQRIGFWVDGKPLYQKTFVYTENTYTDSNNRRQFYTFLADDIDTIASAKIQFHSEGSNYKFYGTTMDGTSSNNGKVQQTTYVNADSSNKLHAGIQIYGDSVSSVDVVATIQYTKTTDTPEPMYISIPVD